MSVLPTFLGGGVIDSDYRGNICMILTNFAACSIEIKTGDRVAQIMLLKNEEVSFAEVQDFDDRTLRGTGGFGSTNKRFFYLAIKKMSENLDFIQFTLLGKENLIKNLMAKQVDLAKFLSDGHDSQDTFLNLHLMFLILIKHSNFYRTMTQRIPNSILTENEFVDLVADELANYVGSHINN